MANGFMKQVCLGTKLITKVQPINFGQLSNWNYTGETFSSKNSEINTLSASEKQKKEVLVTTEGVSVHYR